MNAVNTTYSHFKFRINYPKKSIRFHLLLAIAWLLLGISHLFVAGALWFTLFLLFNAAFQFWQGYAKAQHPYLQISSKGIAAFNDLYPRNYTCSAIQNLRINSVGDLVFLYNGKEITVDLTYATAEQKSELRHHIEQCNP